MEKKYSMTIEPAIVPQERHKIENALRSLGYKVLGGGTMLDGSFCDISFSSYIPKPEVGRSRKIR